MARDDDDHTSHDRVPFDEPAVAPTAAEKAEIAADLAEFYAHHEKHKSEAKPPVRADQQRGPLELIAGHVVLPHVQRFADDVKGATRVKSIGTYPGHSPSLDRALDLFHAISDTALASAISAFAIKNQARYGVRYVIDRQRIWHRLDPVWRWMEDRGDATQNHLDHNHIGFEMTAAGGPSPAPPPPPVSEEDQMFSLSPIASTHIVAAHSGLLLTSAGDRHGAKVGQAPANGSLNQRWQMVGHADGTASYVCRAGDLALDRPDNNTDAGTELQVAGTDYGPAQRWMVEEFAPHLGRLWVPGTNRCVDIAWNSLAGGAPAVLWHGKTEVQGFRNQQFVFAFTI
jgi:hypothetical protein